MVDKKVIGLILKQILKDKIQTKCPTIAEMHTKLSKMTQEEKDKALIGKLNPAEQEYYEGIIRIMEQLKRDMEKFQNSDNYTKTMFERLYKYRSKSYGETIFKYERRIFDGYKPKTPNPVPDVDISQFAQEEENLDKIGELESEMIHNQKNVQWNNNQKSSLIDYLCEGYQLLNSKLNNGNTWKDLSATEKRENEVHINELDTNLHEAINSTKGLTMDVALYHGGVFDVSLVPGDKVHFKGYTSTSFQKKVAEDWIYGDDHTPYNPHYVYRILSPVGTKGVCANDKSHGELTDIDDEHEYLLDKDLDGTIIDVDPVHHLVTIIKE